MPTQHNDTDLDIRSSIATEAGVDPIFLAKTDEIRRQLVVSATVDYMVAKEAQLPRPVRRELLRILRMRTMYVYPSLFTAKALARSAHFTEGAQP